jgi:hypothetical protein
MATKRHKASCHCGKVSVELDLDLAAGTSRCNCSICRKARWWGTSLKPDAVKALNGEANTFVYSWGGKAIDLHICKTCGLRLYGRGDIPQLGGKFFALNIACLDDVSDAEFAAIPVRVCNGRDNDWMHEPAIKSYL